jgi:uncharacterized protein involved in high-affinity Fe2+ transport
LKEIHKERERRITVLPANKSDGKEYGRWVKMGVNVRNGCKKVRREERDKDTEEIIFLQTD